MTDRQKTGRAGEDAAAACLERAGYAVIARNVRRGGGELDIICSRGGVIVFAEVKTRSTRAFGDASLAVDEGKRRRVINAAAAFLLEHEEYAGLQPRFDVLEVYPASGRINHIEGAFIKEQG